MRGVYITTEATEAAPADTPAAITYPTIGIAPPAATLWAPANREPAMTFPMPACVAAANVPGRQECQLVSKHVRKG